MSTKQERPSAATGTSPRRVAKATGGAQLTASSTAAGRRLAAAVLEVLAGQRTPAQAAEAVGVSLPGYYQAEARALQGLLQACEPRPKGRSPSLSRELASLRQERDRLQRALARQRALLRLAQRAVGLPAVAAKATGKKRRRKASVRALQVAARLQAAGLEAGSVGEEAVVEGTSPS